jgi:uroporphyrinogen decarboxylase
MSLALLQRLDGLDTDYTPVVPLLGAFSAQLVNVSPSRALRDPVLQTRAQLAAFAALEPDAIFPFMDLTVEPEALGAAVHWREATGPEVVRPLGPEDLLASLTALPVTAGRLPLVEETVAGLTAGLENRCAVGAYIPGPWTLVASTLGLGAAARLVRRDPEMVARLAAQATRFGLAQVDRLVACGARLVMILEPCAAGGILSPEDFAALALPGLQQLAGHCRAARAEPVVHICGDASPLLPLLARFSQVGLSLDHPVDLRGASGCLASTVTIWGNVDPVGVLMQGDVATVRLTVEHLLGMMAPRKGFVLTSGCEVPPATPMDNLRAMVAAARHHA